MPFFADARYACYADFAAMLMLFAMLSRQRMLLSLPLSLR